MKTSDKSTASPAGGAVETLSADMAPDMMSDVKLSQLLNTRLIKVPLSGSGKESVIAELVDLLVSNDKLKNREEAYEAVLKRERVMSTGVGQSVAIPHGKSEEIDDVVAALGIAKSDIDFESIDEKPVRLVFLLLATPNAPRPHLQVLSRVSRLLSKAHLRQALMRVNNADEALELIRSEEDRHFDH